MGYHENAENANMKKLKNKAENVITKQHINLSGTCQNLEVTNVPKIENEHYQHISKRGEGLQMKQMKNEEDDEGNKSPSNT